MLDVNNLSFSYGDKKVLKNVNFSLHEGQLVFLLGANGAGKSTLFKCMLQILENYTGRVTVNEQDLKKLNHHQRAKLIAYIPQEYRGVFNFSVEEVVLMSTTSQNMFKSPKKEQFEKMNRALEKINITSLRDRGFLELSGGERQLVLVARALAQDSRILIMDEPNSNLDFGNQIHLMEIVKELADEGYLILLSTHNPDFALQYSDRVLIMQDNKIMENGKANDVINNEILSKIYKKDIVMANIENTNLKTCIAKRAIKH